VALRRSVVSPILAWPFGRITVAACAAFVVGISLGNLVGQVGVPLWPWLPLMGLGAVMTLALADVSILAQSSRRWVTQAALCLLSLSVGILWASVRATAPIFQPVWPQPLPITQVPLQGVVESVQPGKTKARAILRLTRLAQQPVSVKVQWTGVPEPWPQVGSTVAMVGTLEAPWDFRLPGVFDQKTYLAEQHVFAVLLNAQSVQVQSQSPETWPDQLNQQFDTLRQAITQSFQAHLPQPHGAILGGLVLGNHAIPVDTDTRQAFLDTGLYHLLAASGMNVGIVAASVLGLLQLLRVPFAWRVVLSMAAVAFYAGLTGMPASIQRAATMLELAMALKLMRRSLSPLVLLALALVLLLLWQPLAVTNVGLQLSVMTTLGLMTCLPPMVSRFRPGWPQTMVGFVLLPVVAQLWAMPLILLNFGTLPKYGVVLNMAAGLWVIPLTTLGFVMASLVSLLTLCPLPGLDWLLSGLFTITQPLIQALVWVVSWGAHLPQPSLQLLQLGLPAPPLWWGLLAYGLLALLAFLLVWTRFNLARHGSLPGLRRAGILTTVLVGLLLMWPLGAVWAPKSPQLDWLRVAPQQWVAVLRMPGQRPFLIAPQSLGFWGLTRLQDYVAHTTGQPLGASVVLADRPGGAWLTQSLATMTDGPVLLTSAMPDDNLALPAWGRLFPGGVSLVWPTQPNVPLRVFYHQLCMMAVGLSSEPSATGRLGCHIQLSRQPSGQVVLQDSRHLLKDRLP
jgi:ComEC/Rec2-related protein